MEITYYGGNCVMLATKQLKVLVDPVTDEYGPDPKVKTDVILYTQAPKKPAAAKAEITIDTPGEYEVKAVTIEGIATRLHTEEDKQVLNSTTYIVSNGNLKALVCGNIHPDLSEEQVEQIDGVDVLVVPVGGNGLTLDKEGAAALLRQFDPSYVVPVHYDDGAVKYPVPQAKADDFLHEVGASGAEAQDSLKVASRDASEDVQVTRLKVKKA